MSRILRTVVILFLIIAVDKVYSASIVNEEVIDNPALRQLEIIDDSAIGNSSLEARSRTKKWLEEAIETPYDSSDSIDSDIQAYSRHNSRGSGHIGGHGHHTGGHHGHQTGRHHGHQTGGHHGHDTRGHHGSHFTHVFMPNGQMETISVSKQLKRWKCGRPTFLKNLDPHSKTEHVEFHLVARVVTSTKAHTHFSTYRFIKIEKVVNGCIWKRYISRQKEIKLETKFINERMLFHGTNKINDILKNGFDERYTQISGNMFGAGLYFAKHSSKSNSYAFGNNKPCPVHNDKNCDKCVRQMMLCRVTLGKMQRETGAKPIAHPKPGYHSLAGVVSPGGLLYPEYVVYRGEQVYPEYVITYKIVK